jgi:hypothetical protein
VPLANAFLKSFAGSLPLDITLVDFFTGSDPSECAAEIASLQPAAVGFSVYLWNRDASRAIAETVRNLLPEASLFAGGPEATAEPAGFLAGSSFDFLIVGEGEVPFAEYCQRLLGNETPAGITGVVMQGQGTAPVVSAKPVVNLDDIPSPYLNGTLACGQYQGVLWQIARGCSFSCDFCFDSRDRHGVRRFAVERIEAELRHFVRQGVSQVFVLDSTFNQDLRRAKQILRLIHRIAPQIHFHFEVRSEFIDRELARLFSAVTCSLQIGLQSQDVLVLKGVGRVFSRDDFVSRTALLNEAGVIFGFDLIYGLPGDTLEGFYASLDFALGLYPNHLDIFPLAILPGTALAARSASTGLHHLKEPPYTLLSSKTFSTEDMRTSTILATACDIFYNRGKAVAWFMNVVATLGMNPSEFLLLFAESLEQESDHVVSESDFDDREIWQMQREFLVRLFKQKQRQRLLPLALDLVDYHFHYAAALLAPPPESFPELRMAGARLLDALCRLASSTQLAAFNYEILDILDEGGSPDITQFAAHYGASGSFAVIYPRNGEVFTESLAEPLYRLLEQLDGSRTNGEIAAGLAIKNDELQPFIEFALSEGIAEPATRQV